MFDIAFAVEGPWENPDDIPIGYLLDGLGDRLRRLRADFSHGESPDVIREAFGFCDSYNLENPKQWKHLHGA